ncbi:MAG: hypothetical protein AAGI01_09445 [Myxococcota bacterium]
MANGTKRSGASCEQDLECQGGLLCTEGVCTPSSCNRAVDPTAYCAEQLGVGLERAECDVDGECIAKKAGFGEGCAADTGCIFGSVCEAGACVETCTTSASCIEEGSMCLARAPGSELKICQPGVKCTEAEEPLELCADVVGLPSALVECTPGGSCQPLQLLEGALCLFDAQCAGGVCVDNFCVRSCVARADCEETNQDCVDRGQGSPVKICVDVEPENCLEQGELDPDEYCAQLAGAPAVCDVETEQCVAQEPSFDSGTILLVVDVSDRGCEDALEPGADISWVQLTREEGLAFGAALLYLPAPEVPGGMDSLRDTTILDGRAISSDENFCRTDPISGEVLGLTRRGAVSLGCGGVIALAFVDAEGETAAFERGDRLIIGETGSMCEDGALDGERVEVYACRDPELVALAGDISSCDILVIEEGGSEGNRPMVLAWD